jgi:hypothetical protein
MPGNEVVPGYEAGPSIGLRVGHNQPVKRVFCPRFPNGYLGDNREWQSQTERWCSVLGL